MKKVPSPHPLPTPTERPEAAVVLYDGNCAFCTAGVQRLPWWDCQGRLAYLSLHDPQVAQQWPEVSLDRLHEEMCIVDATGKRHWGPYAVRYLTTHLRRLWWAAPPLYLPGSMLLWKPLYRLVARNRYRIAGTTCEGDACEVHR